MKWRAAGFRARRRFGEQKIEVEGLAGGHRVAFAGSGWSEAQKRRAAPQSAGETVTTLYWAVSAAVSPLRPGFGPRNRAASPPVRVVM